MSIQNILLAAAGGATLLVLGRIIYLLFLHPLAKFPGPIWARLTDGYGAYHSWLGDAHLDMWRLHEKHGDFVRYMPNSVFIRNADALHAIYSTKAYASVVKSPHYQVLQAGSVGSTFSLRGGHDHLRRRRIVSTALSEKAQRGMDPRIAVHVRKFCEAVLPARSGELGEPMNMAEWCGYLTFDLMSDLVFSASYNLLGREKFRYMPEVIDKSNVRMSVLAYMPIIAAWRAVDAIFFRDALIARNRFLRFVVRAVRERANRALGKWAPDALDPCKPRDDIYSSLAKARDPDTGEGFTASEMVSESTTLVVAGSDTTSTAIAATLFYLADNPYAMRKPRRSYLRACIDEALRMSPPNGAALTREVLPGGLTVGDVYIPGGVTVAVPLYAIHHDERYYVDPFTYRPERWLEDDGTGSVKRARLVFNPFSLGMRGCLGRSLAYHELMTTVATVLYLGDFKFAEGPMSKVGRGVPGAEHGRHRENEYQLHEHITGQKHGPWLRFSRRDISA
ncbi:cytochrome P450 3A31 [Aspergillus niger]|uniref:Cytochrome P450 3A31 n=1 Tax=Aspergillus niger TaxID=5061 RepID=A0A100ITH3_ASPNG|nr:cytochrome P450 3A31 [Aspergillus niger]